MRDDTGNKRTPAPPTRSDTLSATLPLGDTRHKAQNTCGCRVANKQMRADENTHSPIGADWDKSVEGREGRGCLNQYVYTTLGKKTICLIRRQEDDGSALKPVALTNAALLQHGLRNRVCDFDFLLHVHTLDRSEGVRVEDAEVLKKRSDIKCLHLRLQRFSVSTPL